MVTFELSSDEGGPLYRRIAATVRRLIADRRLARGGRLPPARDLASQLGVNVNTVLRAYRDLSSESLVELRQGRGATVVGDAALARLHQLADDLLAEARRLGISRGELAALLIDRDRRLSAAVAADSGEPKPAAKKKFQRS
ncbi:MAG TPA: GntR family transcriptional regulator [Vicinamibacterales bacterium]|nr:GntR family transcriptional regulator [Vicinamibacterales bacterium]